MLARRKWRLEESRRWEKTVFVESNVSLSNNYGLIPPKAPSTAMIQVTGVNECQIAESLVEQSCDMPDFRV